MARYGFDIEFNKSDLKKFDANCEASVRNLFRGTKKATEQGCKEIMADAVRCIPKVTGTAASTAYYEVHRRSDTADSYWAYEGTVGFGSDDKVNPISGEPVSEYIVALHENLSAVHPNGEAKFLENAVRSYMENNFQRSVEMHAHDALKGLSD
jgi:hypothetical protein